MPAKIYGPIIPAIAGINKTPRVSFCTWGLWIPTGSWQMRGWGGEYRARTRASFRPVRTVLSRDYEGRRKKEKDREEGYEARKANL